VGVSDTRILLAGASGLVGSQVLKALLADPGFTGKIVAPVRRPLPVIDPRLATLPLSPLNEPVPALDVFVSCLGTTLKTAGSREGFIAVDRDLVLQLAQLARRHGARRAIVVTSVGASRQSGNFYLRIKGEVEDALEAMGFDRLDIVRPGLLLGARPDRRPAEALAQRFAPFFNPLLIGRLGAYRSIESSQVAHAVARLTSETAAGRFVHCYSELVAQV
jgi:uncharacterized protein YbjT (DUF2867 family)